MLYLKSSFFFKVVTEKYENYRFIRLTDTNIRSTIMCIQ